MSLEDTYNKTYSVKNCLQLKHEFESRYNFYSFGCHSLDIGLIELLVEPGILEFYGESGAGKTQLCMQLSLASAVKLEQYFPTDSNNSQCTNVVVLISTESSISNKRINQLLCNMKGSEQLKHNSLSRLLIFHALYVERLFEIIQNLYSDESISVKLLVIDSIAGAFRYDYQMDNMRERTSKIIEFSYNLKKFIRKSSTKIITTNQLTYNPTEKVSIPCLGLTWSNVISSRVQISISPSSWSRDQAEKISLIEILYSNAMDKKYLKFQIKPTGCYLIH